MCKGWPSFGTIRFMVEGSHVIAYIEYKDYPAYTKHMSETKTHQEEVLEKFDANEQPLIKEAFRDENGLMETMDIAPWEKPEIDEEVAESIHLKIQDNTLHTKGQIHTSVVEVMLKHSNKANKPLKHDEPHGHAA